VRGRRVREMGFFSVMIPGDSDLERIKHIAPKAIFLSGGPNSVHEAGSPNVPSGFWEYVRSEGIPLLGICYGMQLMAHQLGGKVEPGADGGEFGRMPITTIEGASLYEGEASPTQDVWMSHADNVTVLPTGFSCIARSEAGCQVAIENASERLFGLQYHPEVVHSVRGRATLRRFLVDIAGLSSDWSMQSAIDAESELIRERVGSTDHVICALSGGVDSTVAATLIHKVIGDRLHCVFVDNGLLRLDEGARVMDTFNASLHLPVTRVDASEEMMSRLRGVTDPEAKRKAIGAEFIACFQRFRCDHSPAAAPAVAPSGTPRVLPALPVLDEWASRRSSNRGRHCARVVQALCQPTSCTKRLRKGEGTGWTLLARAYRDELQRKIGQRPKWLVQGTLYPDVIESCPPPGSGAKHSHTIKSHHNVGGLPEDLQFELIEPLRELFKDEVREMGRLLGVPEVRSSFSLPSFVLVFTLRLSPRARSLLSCMHSYVRQARTPRPLPVPLAAIGDLHRRATMTLRLLPRQMRHGGRHHRAHAALRAAVVHHAAPLPGARPRGPHPWRRHRARGPRSSPGSRRDLHQRHPRRRALRQDLAGLRGAPPREGRRRPGRPAVARARRGAPRCLLV
jgi:GMP synthase (glutamine-hydrolysing) A subunit